MSIEDNKIIEDPLRVLCEGTDTYDGLIGIRENCTEENCTEENWIYRGYTKVG